MKFCDVCDNMLYVTVNDDKLIFQCKNCNFSKEEGDAEAIIARQAASKLVLLQNYTGEMNEVTNDACIMNINYSDDARSYKQYMNTNVKYDPTLPHVNNIVCPHDDCKTGVHKDKTTDTIYIKYDHKNMKYLYFCCNCENFWRSK